MVRIVDGMLTSLAQKGELPAEAASPRAMSNLRGGPPSDIGTGRARAPCGKGLRGARLAASSPPRRGLAAAAGATAGDALQACPVAHKGERTTAATRVALVAFEAGLRDREPGLPIV